MTGFTTCAGVVHAVSEPAARKAGFSYDGSEFLYGVYSSQQCVPFHGDALGHAMSGWTASLDAENPSAGSVTRAKLGRMSAWICSEMDRGSIRSAGATGSGGRLEGESPSGDVEVLESLQAARAARLSVSAAERMLSPSSRARSCEMWCREQTPHRTHDNAASHAASECNTRSEGSCGLYTKSVSFPGPPVPRGIKCEREPSLNGDR